MSDTPLRIGQVTPFTTNIDGIPGTTSPDVVAQLMPQITTQLVTSGGLPVSTIDPVDLSQYITTIINTTPTGDYGPPQQPSAPVLTGIPTGIQATWDGKNADGSTTRVADWDHVDVHMSTTSGFTPSATTVVATMVATSQNSTIPGTTSQGGSVVISDTNYGVTQYVVFIAVARSGQQSLPSAQSSGTPLQISNIDVQALSLEVTTFKNLQHFLY